MRSVIDFTLEDIDLSRRLILRSQGVPDNAELSENFERIYLEATRLFHELAAPKGVIAGIDNSDFKEVFHGEGLNEKKNPVEDIFRKSSDLALFAVTLGSVLSERVSKFFDNGDYAVGYMLDSVSSYAADELADLASQYLHAKISGKETTPDSLRVLSYSPGYCGWHISGQKKLFEALHPEDIGITLNESFLMTPIKSVSGVLIGGSRKIHEFVNSYPFCSTCTVKTCIERMRS